MQTMLKTPRFDEKKRIEELIKKLRDSQIQHLQKKALRYATHLALSGFFPATYIQECWHGLSYFKLIESLSKNLSKNLPLLIDKLLELKEKLFTFHQPHLILSCSEEVKKHILKEGCFGLNTLSSKQPFVSPQLDYSLPKISSQGRLISSFKTFFYCLKCLHNYYTNCTLGYAKLFRYFLLGKLIHKS